MEVSESVAIRSSKFTMSSAESAMLEAYLGVRKTSGSELENVTCFFFELLAAEARKQVGGLRGGRDGGCRGGLGGGGKEAEAGAAHVGSSPRPLDRNEETPLSKESCRHEARPPSHGSVGVPCRSDAAVLAEEVEEVGEGRPGSDMEAMEESDEVSSGGRCGLGGRSGSRRQ